jgi:hypothetical protein
VGELHKAEKGKEEANIPRRPNAGRSNNTSADVRITVGTSWLASTTTAASSKSIPAKQNGNNLKKKKIGLLSSVFIPPVRVD